MKITGTLATALVAVAIFGCKGSLQTSVASAADGTGAFAAATGFGGGATRVENIADDTMDNKTAFSVTIPARWKFQGSLLQGGPATCDSYVFSFYRASSEDGRSFGEVMPQLMWVYGNGPKPKAGCLPIDKPMGAQEFLRNLSTTMQVEYVADDAVPDSLVQGVKQSQDAFAKSESFYMAHNLPVPRNTVEAAAANVRYKKDGSTMKGRLTAFVQCTETTRPGMKSILPGMASTPAIQVGKCTASVAYVTAPEGQFASVVQTWDNPAMGIRQNKEWGDAWVKRTAEQANASNNALMEQVNARFAAQRQEIAHTMAVQQQVHDQFLQTMQEGTDRSMARAAEIANSNHRMASDMVDYSLDRQTVLNTQTGVIYKITNQVTPGGDLQKLHGDGSVW